MILDKVLESTSVVEIAGPALQRQGLLPEDLDAFYMVAVPEWLEDTVGEAQANDRGERLQGEEVVYAEDGLLGKELVQEPVKRLGRFEVDPEGLLDGDPTPFGQVGSIQCLDRWDEDRRREGQVDDDRFRQGLERRDYALWVGYVRLAVLEGLHGHTRAGVRRDAAGVALEVLHDQAAKAVLVVPTPPVYADDLDPWWKLVLLVELGQGGHEVTGRQISRGPQNH